MYADQKALRTQGGLEGGQKSYFLLSSSEGQVDSIMNQLKKKYQVIIGIKRGKDMKEYVRMWSGVLFPTR